MRVAEVARVGDCFLVLLLAPRRPAFACRADGFLESSENDEGPAGVAGLFYGCQQIGSKDQDGEAVVFVCWHESDFAVFGLFRHLNGELLCVLDEGFYVTAFFFR